MNYSNFCLLDSFIHLYWLNATKDLTLFSVLGIYQLKEKKLKILVQGASTLVREDED